MQNTINARFTHVRFFSAEKSCSPWLAPAGKVSPVKTRLIAVKIPFKVLVPIQNAINATVCAAGPENLTKWIYLVLH